MLKITSRFDAEHNQCQCLTHEERHNLMVATQYYAGPERSLDTFEIRDLNDYIGFYSGSGALSLLPKDKAEGMIKTLRLIDSHKHGYIEEAQRAELKHLAQVYAGVDTKLDDSEIAKMDKHIETTDWD